MLEFDGWYFGWKAGRQLASMSKPGSNIYINYGYNDSGIRTSKTVNGVTTYYYLNGSNVVCETNGTDTLNYFYDDKGSLIYFTLNDVPYYYVRNGQNDIVAILDNYGNEVVNYRYDTWGMLLDISGSLASTVGVKNPYRYRGYRYDTETGLYYVGARYYDPVIGRFINADSLVSTGSSILGTNMFSYCDNNPVNKSDPSGHCPEDIQRAVQAVVNAARLGIVFIGVVATKKNLDQYKKDFVVNTYAAALKIETQTKIPAAIITAQAIYESGYGKQTPKDKDTGKESYNLFGIKGTGPAGSVSCWTYEKNRSEKIVANFKAYNSFAESLDDHSALLTNSRYGHLIGKSVKEWAYGLQDAGYCQDSDYGEQLMNVIEYWYLP